MNITVSSVRCALQIALLGAITKNLRAINANIQDKNIEIYFYYETTPSEEEKDLSEIVETEIYSYFMDVSIIIHAEDFSDMFSLKTNRDRQILVF